MIFFHLIATRLHFYVVMFLFKRFMYIAFSSVKGRIILAAPGMHYSQIRNLIARAFSDLLAHHQLNAITADSHWVNNAFTSLNVTAAWARFRNFDPTVRDIFITLILIRLSFHSLHSLPFLYLYQGLMNNNCIVENMILF